MKKTKNFLYLFGVFLVCVLLLVFVLYRFTTGKLNTAMETSAKKQLTYATERLEDKNKEIEMLATSLSSDQTIRFFHENLGDPSFDNYEYVSAVQLIREKLRLALLNAGDVSDIIIYWPEFDLMIGPSAVNKPYEKSFYEDKLVPGKNWFYKEDIYCFTLSYPFLSKTVAESDFFVLVKTKRNFLNDLRVASSNVEGARSVVQLPDKQVVFPDDKTEEDVQVVNEVTLLEGKEKLSVDNKEITVLVDTAQDANVSIMTYFDSNAYMRPMIFISIFTFAGTFLLLCIGLLLMFFFYKNIFSQMNILVANFRKVENGNLDAKISTKASNEFSYVFNQFNQMTSGVNRILHSLDNEYMRRNIAERKHLQAQINPHFLYNSLFYIISVADDPNAVREMTSLLAEYYQYRTKAKSYVTIDEEIQFSETYLGIMSLRKSIDYQIVVEESEALLDEMILPLLIQPLLENAVQHGIEASDTAYRITLRVCQTGQEITISVEDDGPGLSASEIDVLLRRINQREGTKEEGRVGLWNINQRLVNYYGQSAALVIHRSLDLGGLAVKFTVQGEKSHETIDSR